MPDAFARRQLACADRDDDCRDNQQRRPVQPMPGSIASRNHRHTSRPVILLLTQPPSPKGRGVYMPGLARHVTFIFFTASAS